MGLRSDHTAGRSWSPVGKTPVIEGTGQRFGANVISAISNKGHLSFRVFKEKFVAASSSTSCPAWSARATAEDHPDPRRASRAPLKEGQRMGGRHAEEIELQFLPATHRAEPTSCSTKTSRPTPSAAATHTQDELIKGTRSYLRSRQKTPRIVANYFEEKHVAYAKAA